MTATATETNDVEALLDSISKADFEGDLADLRAVINVFLNNPKPTVAENAKSRIASLQTKAKDITAHAALAHKTLGQLERICEAKALATFAAEKQKWIERSDRLEAQIATCNQALQRARKSTQQTGPAQPFIEPESPFTPSQKSAVRETIRKAWMQLQDPLSFLIRVERPITIEIIKQIMPLEQLGLHYTVHDAIYRATYKSLLDERERWRKQGPNTRLSDSISNVFHAMMNAIGY